MVAYVLVAKLRHVNKPKSRQSHDYKLLHTQPSLSLKFEPQPTHQISRSQLERLSNLRQRQQTAIMATELTVQSERAFQKQPHIFLNSKSKTKSTKVGKGGRRWYKDVGLGFRTPKTAIEGTYIGELS